jgi:transcriptional regulator with XRE-family HTH domain
METPGDPPPEGRIIEEAREKRRLSQNKAAERAGLSGTRWRQIVTGTASGGKGIQIPVRGRAETVARMAQVVGVMPEQLAQADREDAAEELRGLAPPESPKRPPVEGLRELRDRFDRILADGDPGDVQALDKFTRAIDPGNNGSQTG